MTSEPRTLPDITLRHVLSSDNDFLVEVYASTRAEEMAMVPWTDEQRQVFVRSQFNAQQTHYREKYPTATHEIILWKDRPVGQLYVARLDKEIRIVDITLMPTERGRGIGSYLINQLLEEAQRKNKITRIYVEEFNPSLSLFQRLGFNMREQHGFHLLMEWTPPVTDQF
jgi:ribosomal protein S18 acetylase RimI-like enzyme